MTFECSHREDDGGDQRENPRSGELVLDRFHANPLLGLCGTIPYRDTSEITREQDTPPKGPRRATGGRARRGAENRVISYPHFGKSPFCLTSTIASFTASFTISFAGFGSLESGSSV